LLHAHPRMAFDEALAVRVEDKVHYLLSDDRCIVNGRRRQADTSVGIGCASRPPFQGAVHRDTDRPPENYVNFRELLSERLREPFERSSVEVHLNFASRHAECCH
jgi:hypothetical protein